MLRNFLLAVAGCLSAASLVAETPTITISKSDTIALAVSPISGPEGTAITKTLESDLILSGLFSITDANKAGMVIAGAAEGATFQGKVVDHSNSNVLLHSYSGSNREKAHAFANDIIETLTGHRGMARSRIAFIANRTGHKELYTADYDGANVRQITNDANLSVAPALSWDGSKIAYTSYLKGYADIYLIDLASGRRDRIVKFPGTNSGAAFSPNGDKIACSVSKDGNPELYVVNSDGSGANRLTHTPGVESSPSWSPDGREIVYSSDDRGTPQLYRISASGGTGHYISTGHSYCTEPCWSPDGKKIVFNVREGGVFQIALLDINSNVTRIVGDGEDDQNPTWGPDSRHVMYSHAGALFLLDTQTGRKTKILDGFGSISEPTWSLNP